MSTAKKPYERYRIIDMCLRSRTQKYWSVQELIDAIGKYDIIVKRRALLYDIDAIKHDELLGFNAPIEYCHQNKGYHYTNPNFSIEKIPLSESELQSLADSLAFVKYKGAFKEFGAVIDKLLKLGQHFYKNTNTVSVIEFQKAPFYLGEEFIDPLIGHIRNQQPITITYQKFNKATSEEYCLHPYYLKEYAHRWYLLCLHNRHNDLRTFALDRFISIASCEIPFKPCALPDPKDYFKNIVGITLASGQVEEIILSFNSAVALYLLTQPIHESQEVVSHSESELVIKLKLIPNFELCSLLLSHGRNVKIISPQSLQQTLSQMK